MEKTEYVFLARNAHKNGHTNSKRSKEKKTTTSTTKSSKYTEDNSVKKKRNSPGCAHKLIHEELIVRQVDWFCTHFVYYIGCKCKSNGLKYSFKLVSTH